MKKIVLSLAMLLAIISLASCSLTPQTTIEFSSLPETVYEAGEYTDAQVEAFLEKVSVKVTGIQDPIKLTNELVTVSGFDKATLKTPGSYTLVVLFDSASVVFNYTVVAKVEPQKVYTAEELKAALDKGGIIELEADINYTKQFEITKSVAIYGNGHTISVTKEATRVFNLSSVSNIHVQLYSLKMVSAGERGISLFKTTDVEFTMNECELSSVSYGLNLASGNNGTVVTINNSHIVSYGALNIWANTAVINVNDSVLEGVNNYSEESNNFGTIVLNGGHYDYDNLGLKAGDTGQNNVLNIKNTQVIATENGACTQYAVVIQGACVGNTVTFENCEVSYEEGSLYSPDEFHPASNVFTIDGVRK
jgi:hypothetical protein